MLKKFVIIITLLGPCLLAILLNITTPATAGPFGILAIFVFAYLSSLGLTTIILFGVSRGLAKLSHIFMARKPITPITLKMSYNYSTVIAFAPIMLIGFQSVGDITIYELLLLILFLVIGCIYVAKRIR